VSERVAVDVCAFIWLQAMPLADLHIGSQVRLFGQLITAFAKGVQPAPGPIDEDHFDLLQGFADLRFPFGMNATITLRGGRELLAYMVPTSCKRSTASRRFSPPGNVMAAIPVDLRGGHEPVSDGGGGCLVSLHLATSAYLSIAHTTGSSRSSTAISRP